MPEIINFPEHRSAPPDWMLADLFELRAEIMLLTDNDDALEIIAELLEGRSLELEMERYQ